MPVTMDARYQNFWVENIEKEAALRFAWQVRYSKEFSKNRLPQATTKPGGSASGKSFKENISEQIEKLESKITEKGNKEQEALGTSGSGRSSGRFPSRFTSPSSSRCRSGSRHNKRIPASDMRPPTSRTKALLYDGISAHGEGRISYLSKRKFLSPEEKYEFPVLSSCQYGWKILDLVKEPNKSKFARTCIVRDTFYKNSGIEL